MQRRINDKPGQVMEALEGRTMLSGLFGSGLPEISISNAAAYEGNVGASDLAFRLDRSSVTFQAMGVQYETFDATAKAGSDYVYSTGVVYFDAGSTTTYLYIPILGNLRTDGNRSFTVRLSNAPAATFARDTAIGTIVDDDLPIVGVKATKATASNVGPVNGNLRFSRTADLTKDLKVLYAVSGTAKPGVDYTKLSGSAVIKAGKTYVDVPVKPISTSSKPSSRTVIATIKSSSTYFLSSATKATVTITNKEAVPPSAKLTSNPGISVATTAAYKFTAVYTDNAAMNLSSILSGNLRVTGPNSYSQPATLVSKKLSKDGKTVTAVYSVLAPGGGWDVTDNGTYTIAVVANQVKDTAGNAVLAGGMGTFVVAVA